MKRRNFLKNASLTGVGLAVGNSLISCTEKKSEEPIVVSDTTKVSLPLVIATWDVKNATAKARPHQPIINTRQAISTQENRSWQLVGN